MGLCSSNADSEIALHWSSAQTNALISPLAFVNTRGYAEQKTTTRYAPTCAPFPDSPKFLWCDVTVSSNSVTNKKKWVIYPRNALSPSQKHSSERDIDVLDGRISLANRGTVTKPKLTRHNFNQSGRGGWVALGT